jgi:transcriptional regulator with XRE-family HTH domain
MDAKSLGPIIREWRIESRLTQQELAENAGLHKRLVGSIERGERAPETRELAQLCQALGKTPTELLTIWYRACLNEFNELGKLQDLKRPFQPEEKGGQKSPEPTSKVDQIIDQIAALAKDLYRESRNEFQKIFLSWLAQAGPPNALPPPSPPKRAGRRVRKGGSTKA